jgi:hypothetical protein
MGTSYALLTAGFTVSATILFVSDKLAVAIIVLLLAVVMGFAFIRLLRRIDRLDKMM